MFSHHNIYFRDAADMRPLADESVDLVVTSPPYPMIEMWDEVFCRQDRSLKPLLQRGRGSEAFERMHAMLDAIWRELWRVVKKGGFVCINVGDATRTLGNDFALYPNHVRILTRLRQLGFTVLPDILWRKQTNAPNKFMGSGMLPAGAYVTLEHEYILILRKGGKREFVKAADKQRRHESAIFWEERNNWFSDVWFDLKGSRQELGDGKTRSRSGAFPFELAARLVLMYSVKGDLVLDPFAGTGTTMAAAMAYGRNSAGFEIDRSLSGAIHAVAETVVDIANHHIDGRLAAHLAFCRERLAAGKPIKHVNEPYGFPVITAQERRLVLDGLTAVRPRGHNAFEVAYAPKRELPRHEPLPEGTAPPPAGPASQKRRRSADASAAQMSLFGKTP